MKKEQRICETCVDYFTNYPSTVGLCLNLKSGKTVVNVDTPGCKFWGSRHEFRERSRQEGPGRTES